jgi:3-phenylpropionate/trans-cinnamate dioxygenase ferredoxin reductase component
MQGTRNLVIAGAALAGAKAAEALRAEGFDGPVTLIGDEMYRPYERPPLSKEYLIGKADLSTVFVHGESWYGEHDVDLRLGSRVARVDRAAHRVEMADGSTIGYHKLLLATGSSPRALRIDGADAEGVLFLRRIEDSERLKYTIGVSRRLVVIGAGWIGLEVAAAARMAGAEATVVEAAPAPLLRVLGPEVAEVFTGLHREHGVDFRFRAQVEAITTANGRATGVRLADGSVIGADAVLMAVGAAPNTGLAEDAGLRVRDGIVADAGLTTDDPDIYATGDAVSAFHPFLGRHLRVEHWANALNQPATAAASMLGKEAAYDRLPYFFTDQYDLGMEYTGYVPDGDYDRVVIRGDVAAREFIAFWLKDGRVLAGMNVNVWDVTDPIRDLIRSRVQVNPAALAHPDQPLEKLTQH